jgi:hypothetical protein
MVFDQVGQSSAPDKIDDASQNKGAKTKNRLQSLLWNHNLRLGIALFAIYALIAAVVLAPVTSNITALAPGSGGDTFQNLWDIWWVGYATFTLHTSFYYTNLLYWPIGSSLVYQTMAPIASLISVPFQAVSLQFAYNVMLLIGFALSGLTMFMLSDYIVKNKTAAFVAGLVFAFSSFHIAQAYAHIDWINIEWIPLAIYFFLRMVRENGKLYSAIGLSASFVLAIFMGDVEQGIELVLALTLILVAYAIMRETRKQVSDRRFLAALVFSIIVAFILGSWGFLPIIGVITQPNGLSEANQLNNLTYSSIWSANIGSFLIPSYYNGLFDANPSSYFTSVFGPDPTETVAYIGYSAIALILYGLYTDYKRRDYTRGTLWLGLAVIFGLLSMGPAAILYVLYHSLGPLSVIREPGRFQLIFSVSIAMLAAFGFNDLASRFQASGEGKRNVIMLAAVFTLIFLIENNGIALSGSLLRQVATPAPIPSFYNQLSSIAGNFSVLELPILPDPYSSQPGLFGAQATYYTTASHKPIIGGDTTRFNVTQELSLYRIPIVPLATYLEQNSTIAFLPSPVNQNPGNESILSLREYNTAFVIVNLKAYSQSSAYALVSYLQGLFGNPVYSDNQTIVFSMVNATLNPASGLYRPYRSFVAYPMLTQWHQMQLRVNNTVQYPWTPAINASALYGEIFVVAPYANQSGGNYNAQQIPSPVSARIRLEATTNFGNAGLSIDSFSPEGVPTRIAKIPVAQGMESYVVNVTLLSGPIGNSLFFVQNVSRSFNGSQQLVLVQNITITRQ